MFLFGISKLRWTRPWLAKLFGRRMVHGLWWGTLTSDFTDKKTGAVVPPLDIAFVVRQGYFFVSINSYTRGQPAKSTLEALTVDAKSEAAQLQYVFEMRRHRFGENKITFGFGDLTLSADDKRLSGTYWTNSPTQGELSLELLTRECDGIHAFADAEAAKQKLALH